MDEYKAEKLLEFIRSGLVEQEHSGFLMLSSKNHLISRIGADNNYPFYLRSCAKPLQASLLIDFELDKYYDMTSEEIAICCASHTGEPCHTSTIKNLLNKLKIDENDLKCGLHKPLSKIEQEKLILLREKENILQNNCSGKHIMMLGICKKNHWDLNTYEDINHPLQKAIKKKIYSLCEISTELGGKYPVTKDGCGVPIWSMPLENMIKGYLNLFLNKKYSKITNAFIKNPYLIGGENRLDTAIMKANSNLIAKVGAGGLCIIINLEKEQALIVKISDSDMKARALATIELLKQLKWLNKKMLGNKLIVEQSKTDILTLHGEKIGKVEFLFNL